MTRAVALLLIFSLGCASELDQAAPFNTTEAARMTTFDPEAAGAAVDFVDGTTTVDANFLDALEVRFANPRDAVVALRNLEGRTAILADQNFSTEKLDMLDNVEIAELGTTAADASWDCNSEWLFVEVAGLKVRRYSMYPITGGAGVFEAETPATEYEVAWSGDGTKTIDLIYATDLYLIVVGNSDSGYQVEIFDLEAGSTVGQYAVTGTPVGSFERERHAVGRTHFFLQTDTATATIYAIDLSTAAIDSSWGTSGAIAPSGGVSEIAIDDRWIVAIVVGADDAEVIDVETGTSAGTNAGLGSGTVVDFIVADGKGHFFMGQNTPGYIGKYQVDEDDDLVLMQEQALGTDAPAGGAVTDGRWVYFPQAAAPPVVAYSCAALARWDGANEVAGDHFHDESIRFDGLHIIGNGDSADSWAVDGPVRLKGIETVRRVQRIRQESYGRTPYNHGLVPVD